MLSGENLRNATKEKLKYNKCNYSVIFDYMLFKVFLYTSVF